MEDKDRIKKYRVEHEVEWSLEKYKGIEGIDYVECKLCGKRGLYIDSRHLKSRHSISKEEYKSKFPSAKLISDRKRKVQSGNAKDNKANLGKKFSKEHRNKISKSKLGSKNPFFSKTHSKETIEQAKKKREQTLLDKYNVTNVMQLDSAREKISRYATKRVLDNSNNFGKCNKFKNGFFYSTKNNKQFYYRSSYELKFMQELENDINVKFYEVEPFSIKYEYDGIIHRYIPDFIINNYLIVEIKPRWMMRDPQTIAKIETANKFAIQNGYKFKLKYCN